MRRGFLGAMAVLVCGLVAASQAAHAGVPLTRAEVEQVLSEVIAQPKKPESFARFLAVLPAMDALSPVDQAAWLGKVAATKQPLLAARASYERMAFGEAADLGFVEDWWVVADADADADPLARTRAMLATGRAALGDPLDPDDVARTWEQAVIGPRGAVALDHLIVPDIDQVAFAVGRMCITRPDVIMRLGVAGDVVVAIDGFILGQAQGLRDASLDQLEVPLTGATGRHVVVVAVRPIADATPVMRVRFTDPAGLPIDTRCRDERADEPRAWEARGSERDAALAPPAAVGPANHLYGALARQLLGFGDAELDEALTYDGGKLGRIDYVLAASALPRVEARMSALARRVHEPEVALALASLAADRGQLVRARELLSRTAATSDAARWVATRVELMEGRPGDLTDEPNQSERAQLARARGLLEEGRADRAALVYDALIESLPSPERLDVRAAAQRAFVAAGRPGDAVALAQRTARQRPDRVLLALDAAEKMVHRRVAEAEIRAALTAADARARWKPDALVLAGRLWEAIGDKPAAIERYARAVIVQPSNDDARRRLEALQGEEPAPLTIVADAALGETRPLDPAAPWEVLSEELIVNVARDGSSTRWLRRIMRAQHPPAGREDRTFRWRFDPSQESVRVLGARVVHPDGTVAPVRDREMQTLAEDWYGLYFDVRVLTIPFDGLVPGSMVEVTLRIDSVGQHFPGVFELVEVVRDRVPKHRHRIVVDAPTALGLSARLVAGEGAEARERRRSEGERDIFELEASGVAALLPEQLAPGASEVSPVWQVTSFDSWSEVARWYRQVLNGQVVLTPDMKARVAAIQAAEKNDPTRVTSALVALVQREIRYVGLEFGIHGYKPYRTDQVWTRRFGDCKDQALLLRTLLAQAGIASDVVLVRTRTQGRIGLDREGPLPSLAIFDHAIVWLRERGQFVDSTVVHHGMNELPAPDQGAQVLLVDEATERLTLTPSDPPTRNQVVGAYSITLDPNGFGGIQGTVAFHGANAPYYRALLAEPATQMERLQAILNRRYPGLALESARVSDPEAIEAPVELTFHAGVQRLATSVGQALHVLKPAGIDGQSERVAPTPERAQPVVLGPPMSFDLTFRYVPPTGFVAKRLPAGGGGQSPFGRWSVTWSENAGVVQVETRLSWLVDQVEARDYAALRRFVREFDEAVSPALVLERAP